MEMLGYVSFTRDVSSYLKAAGLRENWIRSRGVVSANGTSSCDVTIVRLSPRR